jgi:uncharacterized protein YcbX
MLYVFVAKFEVGEMSCFEVSSFPIRRCIVNTISCTIGKREGKSRAVDRVPATPSTILEKVPSNKYNRIMWEVSRN